MITPISSIHPADIHQVAQPPAEPKPDPHAETPPIPKSGALSHDQVTLRSAGDIDHDTNNK